jgi:RimJ/RimL family protein N-acetyltransferase
MSALLPDVNPKGVNYAVLLRADLDLDVEVNQARNPDSNAVFRPGGFLGWVGTWKSDPEPEVGLIFHRSTWGLGFATEALSAFLELFWKERPEFEHLEAWVDEDNSASSNVLRKCGFDLVETCKGDYTLKWMVPELRNSLHFRARRPDSTTASGS